MSYSEFSSNQPLWHEFQKLGNSFKYTDTVSIGDDKDKIINLYPTDETQPIITAPAVEIYKLYTPNEVILESPVKIGSLPDGQWTEEYKANIDWSQLTIAQRLKESGIGGFSLPDPKISRSRIFRLVDNLLTYVDDYENWTTTYAFKRGELIEVGTFFWEDIKLYWKD